MTPPATGLTPFLIGMLASDDAAFTRALADPERIARRHGLPLAIVTFNLEWWRGRR